MFKSVYPQLWLNDVLLKNVQICRHNYDWMMSYYKCSNCIDTTMIEWCPITNVQICIDTTMIEWCPITNVQICIEA